MTSLREAFGDEVISSEFALKIAASALPPRKDEMIMKKFLVFIFVLVVSFPVFAESVVHEIGTTGYMIREAMHSKAAEYASDLYEDAVKKQYEAKAYLRGTHPEGRSLSKARLLTKQAYDLAKQARDKSLKQLGWVASH